MVLIYYVLNHLIHFLNKCCVSLFLFKVTCPFTLLLLQHNIILMVVVKTKIPTATSPQLLVLPHLNTPSGIRTRDFWIQNMGIYLFTYSVLIWLFYLAYCTFYSFLFVAFSVLLVVVMVVVALGWTISLLIFIFFFIYICLPSFIYVYCSEKVLTFLT